MQHFCAQSNEQCKFSELCSSDIPFQKDFPKHFKKIKMIDIELLEFLLLKQRKIVKKELMTKSKLEEMINYCEINNIKYFVISSSFDISDNTFKNHRFNIILYKQRDQLKSYVEKDLIIKDGDRFKIGYLLGYPRCCVDRYSKTDLENNDFRKIKIEKDYYFDYEMRCPLINPFQKMIYRIPFEEKTSESFERAQRIFYFLKTHLNLDMRFEDVNLELLEKIDSQDKKYELLKLFGSDSLLTHGPCSNSCKATIKKASHILEYIEKTLGTDYVKAYMYYMKKKYKLFNEK